MRLDLIFVCALLLGTRADQDNAGLSIQVFNYNAANGDLTEVAQPVPCVDELIDIDFASSEITHDSLNISASAFPWLHYDKVGTVTNSEGESKILQMRIERADNGNAAFQYKSGLNVDNLDVNKNGKFGLFGNVNVDLQTTAKLTFSFLTGCGGTEAIDSGTCQRYTMSKFFFTFFDLDQSVQDGPAKVLQTQTQRVKDTPGGLNREGIYIEATHVSQLYLIEQSLRQFDLTTLTSTEQPESSQCAAVAALNGNCANDADKCGCVGFTSNTPTDLGYASAIFASSRVLGLNDAAACVRTKFMTRTGLQMLSTLAKQ